MLSHSVRSDSLWPHGLQPARLLHPWGFSRQEFWSGMPCPRPGDLSNSGIKPEYPALQADSLPSEPPGKPKNTGMGSLYLLQGNFLTQELNRGLLNCRWILYQLSYLGSPLVAQLCPTLCDPTDCSPPGPFPWNSSTKNTTVDCHFLLQWIFLTRGSNRSLALQADSLPSQPPGKPP